MRRQWLFATVASSALILTGCSPDALDSGDSADNVTAIATSLSPPAAADAPLLKTADSPLGTIAVDGEGMTVYVYNPDEENSQAGSCDEACLRYWPAVTSVTDSPIVEGIDAVIDTVDGPEGSFQITVNGKPVYRYLDDKVPGDMLGQSVGSLWWMIDTAGNPVFKTEYPSVVRLPSGFGVAVRDCPFPTRLRRQGCAPVQHRAGAIAEPREERDVDDSP
jgi:predicted lipoprotein with Yx(FWY)xxD motif